MENSKFLGREENKWMLTVMEVVRTTSLYFQPQIRTKILNEGWASYWHDNLFMKDDRIKGHEVDYAVINAKVTSMPRVGLNPYALGMRLFSFLENQVDKGKLSFDYRKIFDHHERMHYDENTGRGKDFIFSVRESFCDAMFINAFIDQEFVDLHRLFVVDRRLNKERMTWEYYVKSRKASQYKAMIADSLYHPPAITINVDDENTLVLSHVFEGKPLYRDYIEGSLLGIAFLWGGKTSLYTFEPEPVKKDLNQSDKEEQPPREIKWRRIRYTMKDKKLTRVQV
jgi:stage V sporulation protein R